ncbi:MAG: D-amino-acid transaminase [Rhodospirillales bacterium]|nr:D-amino-acid transaminase [Rhodospirillales bacterium]
MPRYAYVNGAYLPHKNAAVHIEDRGFQLADGVYEVIACIHGHLADERGHMDRLERSLAELDMPMPMDRQTMAIIMRELLRRNRTQNANVYIQVTRGAAKRDFPYPSKDLQQSVVMTTWSFNYDNQPKMEKGVKAVTVPDIRWKRRDIKTTALIAQVMAKQKAVEQDAYEAWMVDDDGFVTEGASSNAWIVTKDGTLVTRKATTDILRGVTRTALDAIRQELQIKMEERSFTPQEAYEAEEAFNSSAVALVTPIVEIDGHKIGNGKPGKVTLRLYEEYRAYVDGLRGEQIGWKA